MGDMEDYSIYIRFCQWQKKKDKTEVLSFENTFSGTLELKFCEVLDGANHLRSVGVLVVVPGNNLNLVANNGGLGSIEE